MLAHVRRPTSSVWALVVVLLHGAGGVLRAQLTEAGESIRVGVVQGNIDQGVKWAEEWAQRTLANYEAGTREAAAEGARIVVWPETAIPGLPEANRSLAERLESLAVLAGFDSFKQNPLPWMGIVVVWFFILAALSFLPAGQLA